ncbi:MAG: RAMP superfamily CRISPR-associated protein, partial [Bryobacteraceae bacterium]|nr:RAMP superfamily CRISPR-associated protein [Bryobacteraceae bacterium]
GGKTTDTWINPETGTEEEGNLWYEEYLPADCLFVSLIGERRQRQRPNRPSPSAKASLKDLKKEPGRQALKVVQIGGNETVGHGLCYWTIYPSDKDAANERA